MKLNAALNILSFAFVLSLCGFILSFVIPKNDVSDAIIVLSLFIAAASGIIATIYTKKLSRSKQWRVMMMGGILLMLDFLFKVMGLEFITGILNVLGAAIAISALGHYIYLHRSDFRNRKWMWFLPSILLGCLFKNMYWVGGNIIIFSSLLVLAIFSFIQLIRLKEKSRIQVLLLIWQISICICITVFYFRYVKFDLIVVGYLFTWLALIDILLQNEKNLLEESNFM